MDSPLATIRLRDVRGAWVSIGRHLDDLNRLSPSPEMSTLLYDVRMRFERECDTLHRLVLELKALEDRKAVRS